MAWTGPDRTGPCQSRKWSRPVGAGGSDRVATRSRTAVSLAGQQSMVPAGLKQRGLVAWRFSVMKGIDRRWLGGRRQLKSAVLERWRLSLLYLLRSWLLPSSSATTSFSGGAARHGLTEGCTDYNLNVCPRSEMALTSGWHGPKLLLCSRANARNLRLFSVLTTPAGVWDGRGWHSLLPDGRGFEWVEARMVGAESLAGGRQCSSGGWDGLPGKRPPPVPNFRVSGYLQRIPHQSSSTKQGKK